MSQFYVFTLSLLHFASLFWPHISTNFWSWYPENSTAAAEVLFIRSLTRKMQTNIIEAFLFSIPGLHMNGAPQLWGNPQKNMAKPCKTHGFADFGHDLRHKWCPPDRLFRFQIRWWILPKTYNIQEIDKINHIQNYMERNLCLTYHKR